MEAKLVVIGGKANKSVVKLKLPAMIGRSRDADITVSHASVSRHHCLVYELEGALVVRDNGSLNGTVIDGERIQEALLKPGQSLTIGPLTFRADYNFDGEFPLLGGEPSSNGETAASKVRPAPAPSGPAAPEISFADEEPVEEPSRDEPEVAESPLPEVFDDEQEALAGDSSPGGFDFLDEEPAASTTSSKPSFSFLRDSKVGEPQAAQEKIEDSTEVFRIAGDPQPAATEPVAKAPSQAKPAAKSKAAATQGDDDAALDDFLNSLGLEE